MSEESIKHPPTQDNSLAPKRVGDYKTTNEKINGNYLRQNRISFIHGKAVNLYIDYKLITWSRDLSTYFTLGNCLFGAVKLTKNADPNKYGYQD